MGYSDISYLPPEIIDLVLEELRPAKDAQLVANLRARQSGSEQPHPNHDLTSCALVCRAWRELSSRHLFHGLAFTFRPSFDTLEEFEGENIENHPPPRTLKTLEEFNVFLRDNLHVARYVTRLVLAMYPFTRIYDNYDSPLFKLPSVRFLSLCPLSQMVFTWTFLV